MKLALLLMLMPWLIVGLAIGKFFRMLAKAKARVLIVREEKLDAQEDEAQ